MKNKYYKNQSNTEFINSAKGELFMLFDIYGFEVIVNYLIKKLDKELYSKILGTLTCLYTLKLSRSLNDVNYIETKKEALSFEEYEKYCNKIISFNKIEKELYENIETIDRIEFIKSLSETLYWLTRFHYKEKINASILLKQTWTIDIIKTLEKYKRARKGVKMKQLLKIIIGDEVDNLDELRSDELWYKKKYGHRNSEITIDLDKELDASRLSKGDYFIETLQHHDKNYPNIILEKTKCLFIDNKKLSLREYFVMNFENKDLLDTNNYSFDKSKLESTDLLDNIFAIYVIKRAQAGDEIAFKKLFDCYKSDVEKFAERFLIKYLKLNECGNLGLENVKSVALSLFATLLRGNNPAMLYQNLDKYGKEKLSIEDMETRDIARIVEQPYFSGYNLLGQIIEKLQKDYENYKGRIKNWRYRVKNKSKEVELEYLAKIIRFSLSEIINTSRIFTRIEPYFNLYSLMIYSSEYNKHCYRPTKNSSLSLYLFGNIKKRGMMWYKLIKWYEGVTYKKDGKRYIKNEDLRKNVDYQETESGEKGDKTKDTRTIRGKTNKRFKEYEKDMLQNLGLDEDEFNEQA